MNYNAITLEVWDGTTLVLADDYRNAEQVSFRGQYPGGLYADASFFVPRRVGDVGLIECGHRVKFYNRAVCVWEGFVSGRSIVADETTSGVAYTCTGAWGYLLGGTILYKPWADTRMEEGVWKTPLTAAASNDKSLLEWMSLDRNNRARFTPRSTRDAAGAETGWANNDYVRIVYTAPTGQTVKRVTHNYQLAEAAQQWRISVYNATTSADIGSPIETSSTGSYDETLATPSQEIWLYMSSRAAQTPPSDGTVFGEFSAVTVYTETGAIDSTEIAKDIVGMVPGISADTSRIGSNALSLVPFVADGESAAATLERAAGYGDTNYNTWAFYVRESDISSDGLPILCYEQQPALTTAEYAIRLGDANVQAQVSLRQDTNEVRNWISVRYQDEAGRTVLLTPNDDATLTDAASVTAYGTRAEEISLDTTSATTAANYARRYLAARKDPQWTIDGGITVKGYIRSITGGKVPCANIRPGQRVIVENFVQDLNGTGLTFLISGLSYNDDDSGTCTINTGRPSDLDVVLARMAGIK